MGNLLRSAALLMLLGGCQSESGGAGSGPAGRKAGGPSEFRVPGCCVLTLPAGYRQVGRGASDARGAVFESDSARLFLEYDAQPGIPINTASQRHEAKAGEVDGRKARLYTYSGGETPGENLIASATIYTKGQERQPGARVAELKYVCREGTSCAEFDEILAGLQLED